MSTSTTGVYGIDLGTTYSVVGYLDDTGRASVIPNGYGQNSTPSVVLFETESNVVVGEMAKEHAILEPDNVVSLVKKEMGNKDFFRTFYGKTYTAPSISAIILKALAQDASTHGRQMERVVIAVPAYFGMLEREATRQAGKIAGLDVIGIVPEPVAAALAYGLGADTEDRTVVVYDLGGGTFDITVMRLTATGIELLVIDGNHALGGYDWDEVLFENLLAQVEQQAGDDSIRDDEQLIQDLWLSAEQTKKHLTHAESRNVIVRHGGGTAKVTVTRTHFQEMTAHLLDQTIQITRRTLEQAEELPPGVRAEITDVLLVGGSSWMPAVQPAVTAAVGVEARISDPDLSVAKGAAIYAARESVREIESPGDFSVGNVLVDVSVQMAEMAASGLVGGYAVTRRDQLMQFLRRWRRSRQNQPGTIRDRAREKLNHMYPGMLPADLEPTSERITRDEWRVVFEHEGYIYTAWITQGDPWVNCQRDRRR